MLDLRCGLRTDRIRKEWPFWDDLHGFWSELPNYNPVGVSTSTAGQDFGTHAVALFTKPSNNTEDYEVEDHVSDAQSNHGSGLLDLDGVDLGLEILSPEWNFDLERRFAPPQDGGSPDSSEDSSKETKVCRCPILANHNKHDR